MRDCSESEKPHKACTSTFFLRVALDGSGSVVELVTTSVSILNLIGVLEIFVGGAWMLFTTESRRVVLAFDTLSWDVGRNDPCWMVSAAYTPFRSVTTANNGSQLTDCDGRLLCGVTSCVRGVRAPVPLTLRQIQVALVSSLSQTGSPCESSNNNKNTNHVPKYSRTPK